jgi:MFS transporter, SP family, sugar:H+ symporter
MPFLNKPADMAGSAMPAILIGSFVAFGGVLFGYDTGTIGGILAMTWVYSCKYRKTVANGTRYWKDHFSTGYRDDKGDLNVDANQTSLIVSILSAGTFFGALLSGRYTYEPERAET